MAKRLFEKRVSGQRQLCHAHTHRPERYLGTFRTSYSYSYLSIPHHSCSYSRYLGTFLPRLYFCKCSIVFSYPCSEILMNLNLQQCRAHESSSPKHNDKFRLTVVNHLHVECMAKLCEPFYKNFFHKSDHLKKVSTTSTGFSNHIDNLPTVFSEKGVERS